MESERKDAPVTALFTRAEADRLRELMWQRRQSLSSWLRSLALKEARRIEQQAARETQPVA